MKSEVNNNSKCFGTTYNMSQFLKNWVHEKSEVINRNGLSLIQQMSW